MECSAARVVKDEADEGQFPPQYSSSVQCEVCGSAHSHLTSYVFLNPFKISVGFALVY